jgi:hypothetical protein
MDTSPYPPLSQAAVPSPAPQPISHLKSQLVCLLQQLHSKAGTQLRGTASLHSTAQHSTCEHNATYC